MNVAALLGADEAKSTPKNFYKAVNYTVRAWQARSDFPDLEDFPEHSYADRRWKEKKIPSTAIAFSGGGARAFTNAIGILAGLHKLGLIRNIRYIGGVSGGAWASTVFTYGQSSYNDSVLLGPVVHPSELRMSNLKEMHPACLRRLPLKQFNTLLIANTVKYPAAEAWSRTIAEVYLEDVGIFRNDMFRMTKATQPPLGVCSEASCT